MQDEIYTLRLKMPPGMGYVNSYLLPAQGGFLLIDTGSPQCRKQLIHELDSHGCQPGRLNLILLTHGDFDHIGNAAVLRRVYQSKIAMHHADAGMAERGDMFAGRRDPGKVIRALAPLFASLGKVNRFTPDVFLQEGDSLAPYGMDAEIISIPGHSPGSVGILTCAGDLFCGDLLVSTHAPQLNSLVDDLEQMQTSLRRLRGIGVQRVYPGHGAPFRLEEVKGE